MANTRAPAFFSYAREDAGVALRLAADLKRAGANVWLDQLDILPGRPWDREIEEALNACREMVVILSPASVRSNNVMDEVACALEDGKTIIPLLVRPCRVPFRLRRLQYVDFRSDYNDGLNGLLRALAAEGVEAVTAHPRIGTPGRISVTPDSHNAQKHTRQIPADGSRLMDVDTMAREQAEAIRRGNEYNVAQDYTQARQWYEKAASAGSADAMFNLAGLYHVGLGVGQNYTQARQWYERAAAAGNSDAMFNLGRLYQVGLGVTQDYTRARESYERAAAAGNAEAMFNLGWLYDNGQGVAADHTQARQWYEKAAAAGSADATQLLNQSAGRQHSDKVKRGHPILAIVLVVVLFTIFGNLSAFALRLEARLVGLIGYVVVWIIGILITFRTGRRLWRGH